ncbi:MAG: TraM recognition domain-containing protein [Pseudomonadota bacterium]
MSIWSRLLGSSALNPEGLRLIGLSLDSGRPIFAPKGHSLALAAAGSGKTTSGAMPWLFSFLSTADGAGTLILDSKHGEIAIQLLPALLQLGIKFAIIDDTHLWEVLAPHRVNLNAFGAAVEAYKRDPRDAIFPIENISKILIPEPPEIDKNKHFRDVPQEFDEFCIGTLLSRDASNATPGGAASILSDADMLRSLAAIEAEEGAPALRAQARSILEAADSENWGQHLSEARRSLRLFAPGTRLHEVGRDARTTHADLIREGYVVFLIGDQSQIHRMAAFYALHIQAFCNALYHGAGKLRVIADEFTNTPIKSLIGEALTTLRAYGGEIHMIGQSRSEIVRKFGEKVAQTIEENAIVKQWFGFSSFEEAERVSKAIGDEHAVASGLSGDTDGLKSQESLSLNRQRVLSASELLALPREIQLVHIKGVGFFLARTIAQNEIAPYCHLIGDNPLEGSRLPPKPKIRLTTPKCTSGWRWI